MIIDATDTILGRLATFTSKRLLKGEEIIIVNAEKAIVSGRREATLEKYKFKRDVGDLIRGPFVSKMPERLVKRTVRGMLPYKKETGRKAFKRLKVIRGCPKSIGKAEKIADISKKRLKDQNYITIEDICRWLGAKV